ncbi:MAG: nitrate reductase molybdenum cofactor assembly chaperone [Chloroflexota bacterium]
MKLHYIYRLLADLLEYPTQGLVDKARECSELLTSLDSEAAARMKGFLSCVEATPTVHLQEAYTSAFDLQPVCHPYVGYQLLGESYKRAAFLVGLKEEYRRYGFSVENELPDHLPVLLRFLAALEERREGESSRILVEICLIPAVGEMASAFAEKGNPYGEVIRSLLRTLQVARERSAAPLYDGGPGEPSCPATTSTMRRQSL